MNRIFFLPVLFVLLLGTATVYGQQGRSYPVHIPKSYKTTFYYNTSWELTTSDKYVVRRVAFFDFTDMVFDGYFQDYNRDSVLIAEGYYNKGEKTGLHTEYFANRKHKSTIEYSTLDYTVWEFNDLQKKDSVKGGSGTFMLPYFYLTGPKNQPVWRQGFVSGTVFMGKRTGVWTYHDIAQGQKKTDEEYYEKGKLAKRVNYSESGNIDFDYKKEIFVSLSSLFTESMVFDEEVFKSLNEFFDQKPTYPASFNRDITYPGGIKKLILLLAQNSDVTAGEVTFIRLKVDEHGRVTKYSGSIDSRSEDLDLAITAIKVHEKRFLPAIRNGIPYASTITLPVSSGKEWTDYVLSTDLDMLLHMN